MRVNQQRILPLRTIILLGTPMSNISSQTCQVLGIKSNGPISKTVSCLLPVTQITTCYCNQKILYRETYLLTFLSMHYRTLHCVDENGRVAQLPQALWQGDRGLEIRAVRIKNWKQLQCELLRGKQVLRALDHKRARRNQLLPSRLLHHRWRPLHHVWNHFLHRIYGQKAV